MITVGLSEDGCRVALDAPEFAERVVGAVAVEYDQDPHAVGDFLVEIAARQRAHEGLAGLAEARDLPEHAVDGAAAAFDALREAFVVALSEPIAFTVSEPEARSLAVELMRHAGLAAATRTRRGEGAR